MLTLQLIKLYLRIDTDFEDNIILQCMDTAESYMIGAITNYKNNYETDESFTKKADHCKMAIVSELFNNRDPHNDNRNDFSFAIRSMINQLNLYAPEESNDENSRQSI